MGRPKKTPPPDDSDPLDTAAAASGAIEGDPDDVEAMREALGVNTPLPPQDPNAFHDAVDVEFNLAEGETRREMQHEFDQRERDTAEILRGLRELDQGNSVKWAITRVGSSNPEDDGFIDTWPSSLMTLERLRDKFGSGTYYLNARRNGKYAGHKTITIAGDAPRRTMNPQSPGGALNLTEFFAQQQQLDRQRREDEAQRRREDEEREEKRDRRRMELLAIIAAPAATAIATIFGGNRGGTDVAALVAALKPAPPTDPILLMQGLKSLMPEAPTSPQPDVIDKALGIVEKLEAFRGNPNGETTGMDILKELVKTAGPTLGPIIQVIGQRAQAARAERIAAQPVAQPAALPAPEMAPALQPAPEGTDVNLLKAARLIPWLKGHTEKFLSPAQKNRDPEPYAALLLDDLPEDQDPDTLLKFIERTDWFEGLKSIEPRVANFPQWFAQLRAHLLEYMKEEPAQAPETAMAPIGRHRGQSMPLVKIDGGARAEPESTGEGVDDSVDVPRTPSLTERGL